MTTNNTSSNLRDPFQYLGICYQLMEPLENLAAVRNPSGLILNWLSAKTETQYALLKLRNCLIELSKMEITSETTSSLTSKACWNSKSNSCALTASRRKKTKWQALSQIRKTGSSPAMTWRPRSETTGTCSQSNHLKKDIPLSTAKSLRYSP